MSDRTETTWTCERCGDTRVERERGQPSHWARVVLVAPPRASFDTVLTLGDLCHPCRIALVDEFMAGRHGE